MHLSIGLTMGLYLFALIMIVLNLAAFGPDSLAQLTRKLFWRSSGTRLLNRAESFWTPAVANPSFLTAAGGSYGTCRNPGELRNVA